MHCGYPVMAFKCVAKDLVSVQRNGDMWGPIHELGHNQQRGYWEFPPHTTECTCNLWSIYVHEEVLGVNRAQVRFIQYMLQKKQRCWDDMVSQSSNFILVIAGSPMCEWRRTSQTSRGVCKGGKESERLECVGGSGDVHAGKRESNNQSYSR